MKRDRIKTLLLAEALICALLALALWLFEGDAFSVAGFPGSAVGQGLSALAASGRFGFALAFTLYAAVILLPLYALVHIGARRELKPEDALLVLIAFAAACALFPHGWTAYWSTSAEALFPLLPYCDMVLIMTVEPGFGGQGFIPECMDKIKAVRTEIQKNGYKCELEIDGGAKLNNTADIVAAGADVIVAGSAVFGGDIAANVKGFHEVFKEGAAKAAWSK